MKNLNKENLKRCFKSAKEQNMNYIGLLIEMPGFTMPELIINPRANFDKKLEYLLNTYDENLEHKYSKGVKIIGFTFGETCEDAEHDLLN